MSEPLLVVVTGPPASGKTTIARTLATDLGLPLVAKDDLKEALFDSLGTGDREWSRALGRAAIDLLYHWAAVELAAGRPLVVESNFDPRWADARFAALPAHRPFQILCSAPADVILARYGSRERHPGHLGAALLPEVREALADARHGALALGGELVELDTTSFDRLDLASLVRRIRAVA